jgi:hypothetical protein
MAGCGQSPPSGRELGSHSHTPPQERGCHHPGSSIKFDLHRCGAKALATAGINPLRSVFGNQPQCPCEPITGGQLPSGDQAFRHKLSQLPNRPFRCRDYCPAALLDERSAIPSVADFVQLGEICGCLRRLAELVDADRCKSSNHSQLSPFFCDLFNGASERPSAPVEADNSS